MGVPGKKVSLPVSSQARIRVGASFILSLEYSMGKICEHQHPISEDAGAVMMA